MAVILALRHPSNLDDPYPLYRFLRDNAPVHWDEGLKAWVVTRYADVLELVQQPHRLSSDHFRKDRTTAGEPRPGPAALGLLFARWMLYRDPPDQARSRRLTQAAVARYGLDRMRPRIEAIAEGLLDRVMDRGEMDFIKDFTFPLPVTVIATMLGCPAEEIDALKRWSDQIMMYLARDQSNPNLVEDACRGGVSLVEYFRGKVNERTSAPRDDLISLMLQADESGEALSLDEVLANCVMLMIAGHETTTHLLASGLYQLLRHPKELARLKASPSLLSSAVEELLRFDGPSQGMPRVATEPIELHGASIKPGDVVTLMLGSANRDERQFERPDELDLGRRPNRHLAFGHGTHFCLGAALARMEAEIAFPVVLRRLADVALAFDVPRWTRMVYMRGLQALPLRFRLAAGR